MSDQIVGLKRVLTLKFVGHLSDILGGICRTWVFDRWYTWSVLYICYRKYHTGDSDMSMVLCIINLKCCKATTIFLSGGSAGIFIVLVIFFSKPSPDKIFFSHEKESKKMFSYHVVQKYIFPWKQILAGDSIDLFSATMINLICFRSTRALKYFIKKKSQPILF